MKYQEIKPLNDIAKQLIVFVHGLGSNCDDLISLSTFMQKTMPDAHFFSPNGIEPCDIQSFGYQWFSLQNRDPHILSQELERTSPMINNLIKQKQQELNLTNKDTILIGFSQGTMTSLYLSLSAEIPFLGIVGFSGALILPKKINSTNTPICLIHGIDDDIVHHAQSLYAYRELQSLGVMVEHHSIEKLAHTIDLRGINIAIKFIQGIDK